MRAKSNPPVRQAKSAGTARASISFPGEVYTELERIAEEKKVSVAWVVRDAVDKYLAERYPIFAHVEGARS